MVSELSLRFLASILREDEANDDHALYMNERHGHGVRMCTLGELKALVRIAVNQLSDEEKRSLEHAHVYR